MATDGMKWVVTVDDDDPVTFVPIEGGWASRQEAVDWAVDHPEYVGTFDRVIFSYVRELAP